MGVRTSKDLGQFGSEEKNEAGVVDPYDESESWNHCGITLKLTDKALLAQIRALLLRTDAFQTLPSSSCNVHATVKRWTVDADVYRLSSDVYVIRQRQQSNHH